MIGRVAAVFILILVLPATALLAAWVLLVDGGPVLFMQERVGQNGKIFVLYKFRTMVRNADALLGADGSPTAQRLIPGAAVIRRLGVDELPQLLNIVRGDMAWVGPRPMLPDTFSARLLAENHPRFRVRPGLTGLAQVAGRTNMPWSARLRLDSEYVERKNWRLDASILCRTLPALLGGRGFVSDRDPTRLRDE